MAALRSSCSADIAASFCLGTLAGVLLANELSRRRRKGGKRSVEGNDQDVLDVAPLTGSAAAPRRYGSVIRLRPESYKRYRELHDNVWQPVLDAMTRANIRNFTIYHHKETNSLFQHFEWIGHWKTPCHSQEDEQELFERDTSTIANDPVTREWWKECEPCQEPFSQWPPGATPPSRQGDKDTAATSIDNQHANASWWASCECVAYCGHWPLAYAKEQRDPDFVALQKSE